MNVRTIEQLLERPGLSFLVGPALSGYRETVYGIASSILRADMPLILVLTDEGAPEARNRLRTRGLDVEALEDEGRIWYVDAFAPSVGWAHTAPNTIFVEESGVDSILFGISDVESELLERFPGHAILLDSMSSILIMEGTGGAFQLARGLRGMGARLGASVIATLTQGMHKEQEVVPLAHLATNIVNLDEEGKLEVRSEPRAEHLVKGWG